MCVLKYNSLQVILLIRAGVEKEMEKTMATHSSPLAWKIPWTEEPGGLQSMRSRRVGHDWATSLSLFTFMHWRRKWQPTPVFLPGESQGWGSLVGCCLCLFSTTWVTREVARQWYYSIPKSWGGGWGHEISHIFYNPAEMLLHLVFSLRPRLTTGSHVVVPTFSLPPPFALTYSPVSARNVKNNLNTFLYWKAFPVVMHGCESWTIRKAEHLRIDVFELWCWRRPLRVHWTARRSIQSILEEINPDIHWKDCWWSCSSNTLATWCEEPTY